MNSNQQFPVYIFLALVFFCFITTVHAALPQSINYQGYLTNTDGSPVNNASQSITFTLYDSDVGGNALWAENQNVSVVNGVFSVQLGSGTNPLPQYAFTNPVWVGVEVAGDFEMTPRSALNLSPYAIYAGKVQDGVQISTAISGSTQTLTATCANYANAAVTITTTGPGTILVSANAWVELDHTLGTEDRLLLLIDPSSTDCNTSPYDEVTWSIPAEWPTVLNFIERTFHVQRNFSVNGAGTYTYYLNGVMTSGANNDRFWYASLNAIYIPNP